MFHDIPDHVRDTVKLLSTRRLRKNGRPGVSRSPERLTSEGSPKYGPVSFLQGVNTQNRCGDGVRSDGWTTYTRTVSEYRDVGTEGTGEVQTRNSPSPSVPSVTRGPVQD